MKRLVIAALVALTPMGAAAQDANGIWKTQEGDEGGYLHVRVAPCSTDAALTCGAIQSAFDGSGQPSPEYEHLGKPIIWNMENSGGGAYRNGKIWAPDRDKTYNSKMSLSGNALKVEGCVFGICRGQTWSRVQ